VRLFGDVQTWKDKCGFFKNDDRNRSEGTTSTRSRQNKDD